MFQFFGEYECRLDPKGRLKIPSALIEKFNGDGAPHFYLNRGFEQCINLYPKDVWDARFEGLKSLNTYDAQHREFLRYCLRGIKLVQCDNVERITLGKTLCEYANIKQDIILMGMGDYLEIWDSQTFDNLLSNKPEDYATLAQQVLGSSKGNI
ncbi:MAG: division/cell wall cluster transcriptional repressor MraZ [Saprospiraceae bacterium]|jgi:MraZ protein|nr:division/cell wall cluster transcriptional repressor MraZ [Saprospiraceae bacterium]MBL0189992.1 division/cell wall cluster transcriptional repressor MraZ [Saprospiraceae bacterium]